MRNLNLLNAFRDIPGELAAHGIEGDHGNGIFLITSSVDKAPMRVVASNGFGWDHVSVSRRNRCPNWTEVSAVHRLFFKDNECAVQYHVPEVDHISYHPYCLHLWRPQALEMPRPPEWMVGPRGERKP